MLTGVLSLLGVCAAFYLLFCLLLYWRQDAAIFFPVQNDMSLRRQHERNRVEIPANGATLEGWWIDNPAATSSAVIIYFGGNAEDVLYTAGLAHNINARRLLVVNYRGYGRSTGQPGQTALYDDALTVYEYAIRSGVSSHNVVVMGRSLGSGVACMLAGSREMGAAILVTPFDSLAAVAAEHYPAFPVRLLLRHPFPSSDWAHKSHAPALFLAAGRDAVIPPIHARHLYDSWSGARQFSLLEDRGHNDVEQDPRYYESINKFLSDVLPQ